jgi:NitT/TauT family transport system ATP-binding protein
MAITAPEIDGRPTGGAEVTVRALGKVFSGPGGSTVEALKDIDLAVPGGEFFALIGPSGCGKSTLLRLIADLIQPTTGEVLVDQSPASVARRNREYGMVFQAPVLFDWRRVDRNVELPLEIARTPAQPRSARRDALLRMVELADFARHSPWQLSGGMQQRVAIARALSVGPRLLLMDEPFGALDEMTRERMNLELNRIWRETGATIVFVTHSIPEAVFLATSVVVMSPRPGRITHAIPIDLGTERTVETREDARYFGYVTQVREALRADESGGSRDPDRVRAEGLSA